LKETPIKMKQNEILSHQNSLKITTSPMSLNSDGKEGTYPYQETAQVSRTSIPTPLLSNYDKISNLNQNSADLAKMNFEKNLNLTPNINEIKNNFEKISIPTQNTNDQIKSNSEKIANLTPNSNDQIKSNFDKITNSTQNDQSIKALYTLKTPKLITQTKGFLSPNNDGSFKLISPSIEINKTSPSVEMNKTTPTLEINKSEKRKINLDSLSLGINGKAYMDEEKKEKTVSRLTSPKQIETVLNSLENKDKACLEIDKIISSKTSIKTNNNNALYNIIQVI